MTKGNNIPVNNSNGQQIVRAQYKLNYNDYENMCKVNKDLAKLGLCSTIKDFDQAAVISLDVFKKYFPTVQYKKLEPAGTDNLLPAAFAYKLSKNSPEVYILFRETDYCLIDQGRCEMYGEADGHKLYIKPEWVYN